MFSLIQRLSSRATPPAPTGRDDRLRAAFIAAPVGLGVAGFDGRWLLFNDTAATLLGYTREELSRISLHDLTHPEDRARELDFVRRMAAGEVQRYQIEKRIVDKLGNEREVVVTAALVRGRNGAADTIVYVIEKPQPRVESGRTADGLSNTILENLQTTAILRCDARGTILGWNRGAQELFLYSREEVIGRNRRILYRHPDSADEHLRTAAERNHFERDDVRVTSDGRELSVRVTLTPFAPDGAVRGFVEVLHLAPPTTQYDETYVADLREQLDRERDSGTTLTRVVEKLKARVQSESARATELEREVAELRERLASVESAPAAEWHAFPDGGALEVIRTSADDRRSGLLLFVSGAQQKSIQLDDGRIASCASSNPGESFGERLVRRRAITDAQRVKAMELANATNVAIGRAIILLGAMTEDEVAAALREKIDHELAELSRWTDGRWTLINRPTPRVKPVRLALDLDDLRQFARAEFVASRNGTRYHRDTCTAMLRVKSSDRTPIISTLAGAQHGLAPCRLCVV